MDIVCVNVFFLLIFVPFLFFKDILHHFIYNLADKLIRWTHPVGVYNYASRDYLAEFKFEKLAFKQYQIF